MSIHQARSEYPASAQRVINTKRVPINYLVSTQRVLSEFPASTKCVDNKYLPIF